MSYPSGVEQKADKAASKVDDLVGKLRGEVERQALCIDALYRSTALVTVAGPDQPSTSELATPNNDSELVNILKNLLYSFEHNTNKITSLTDRIEL